MPLISVDPSSLVAIVLVQIVYHPRAMTASRWDCWWRILPWVLIQGILVLVHAFRVMKAVHDSHAASGLLQHILAKEEETIDIAALLVTEAIVAWVGIQYFRGPSALQGQRNPAVGDDIELQGPGGRDGGSHPVHEFFELDVHGEDASLRGGLGVEGGRGLSDMDSIVDMPGAFPT